MTLKTVSSIFIYRFGSMRCIGMSDSLSFNAITYEDSSKLNLRFISTMFFLFYQVQNGNEGVQQEIGKFCVRNHENGIKSHEISVQSKNFCKKSIYFCNSLEKGWTRECFIVQRQEKGSKVVQRFEYIGVNDWRQSKKEEEKSGESQVTHRKSVKRAQGTDRRH